jgi:hypothetical protein
MTIARRLFVLSAIVLLIVHGTDRVLALFVVFMTSITSFAAGRRGTDARALVEGFGSVIAVAVGGLAASTLTLTPATRTTSPPRRSAAAFALLPTLAVTSWLIAMDAGMAEYRLGALLPLAAVAITLCVPLFGRARDNAAVIAENEGLRLRSREAGRADDTAHDWLTGIEVSLDRAANAVAADGSAESRNIARAIESARAACLRARRSWSGYPDGDGSVFGSTSRVVDTWEREEKTPTWWPAQARAVWVDTGARWADDIRLLHTAEIERVALAGTLMLRAAFIATLPLWAGLTAGLVPDARPVTWVTVVWLCASVWVIGVALASPWIIELIVSPRGGLTLRKVLVILEVPLALALLVTAPSWVAFQFVAGPVNWLMRPVWSLRRLLVCATGFLLVLVVTLAMRTISGLGPIALEAVVSILVLAVISSSFGLMVPLVLGFVATVLPTWYIGARRRRVRRWRSLTKPVADAVDDALQLATADGVVPEALPPLERAAALLHEAAFEPRPERRLAIFARPRTLEEVLDAGMLRAEDDPENPLHVARIGYVPKHLGTNAVPSWRAANALETLVAAICAEATRYGANEIRTLVTFDDGAALLVFRFENDVAGNTRGSGAGRGKAVIERHLGRLGGDLLTRAGSVDSLGLEVFEVSFSCKSSLLDGLPRGP